MEVLNIIIRILKDVLVSMSVFLVFIKILGYKKFLEKPQDEER